MNYEDYDEYELDGEEVALAPSTPAGAFGQLTAKGNRFALIFGGIALSNTRMRKALRPRTADPAA